MADLALIDQTAGATTSSLVSLLHERLDPQAHLDSLVCSVAGMIGAALATADGRSIAHSAGLDNDPGRAAMIAATMGLAGQLIGVVGGRQLDEVTVRSDAGCVVVYAVGTGGVLTVLARPNSNLHHLGTEVRARMPRLVEVVRRGRG